VLWPRQAALAPAAVQSHQDVAGSDAFARLKLYRGDRPGQVGTDDNPLRRCDSANGTQCNRPLVLSRHDCRHRLRRRRNEAYAAIAV